MTQDQLGRYYDVNLLSRARRPVHKESLSYGGLSNAFRGMPPLGDFSATTVARNEVSPALTPLESRDHDLGMCTPCAFSWKPRGCSAGSTCTFCHLCTKGNFMTNKKRKRTRRKRQVSPQKEQDIPVPLDEPMFLSLPSFSSSSFISDATTASNSLYSRKADDGKVDRSNSFCTRKADHENLHNYAQDTKHSPLEVLDAVRDEPTEGYILEQGMWVPHGSKGHFQGTCQPCVFVHKVNGCREGTNCTHCHLCDLEMYQWKKKFRAKLCKQKGHKECLRDETKTYAPQRV